MHKPLVIPGYPSPSDTQIRLFQKNNRLVVDGIVGPKTRGACWRKEGSKSYTHLAWHPRGKHGAESSKEWTARFFSRLDKLPLSEANLLTLAFLVSSEWSCGLDYCSTQDGLTMGFRRRAGSGLPKLLKKEMGFDIGCNLRQDNNGPPMDDPEMRERIINLATDPGWWEVQLREWLEVIKRHLSRHFMTTGREIALYERSCNSSHRWVNGCYSYKDLVASYSKHKRGPSRIRRIEKSIPEGEKWR